MQVKGNMTEAAVPHHFIEMEKGGWAWGVQENENLSLSFFTSDVY